MLVEWCLAVGYVFGFVFELVFRVVYVYGGEETYNKPLRLVEAWLMLKGFVE